MNLKRTLEPEVMDSAEDARQYDDMDHGRVNQDFVDDLLTLLTAGPTFISRLSMANAAIRTLDVGTGTALIPILMCQQQPAFEVLAIDMAENMLALASKNIHNSRCQSQVNVIQADAKAMPLPDASFDVVISNSIVHHIPDPKPCLAEMVRVLRPDGAIFVRDLLRPDTAMNVEKIVQDYAEQETEYSQRLFRDSLHASLSLSEIRQIVSDLGWAPAQVVATSDRHWTWAGLRHKPDGDSD